MGAIRTELLSSQGWQKSWAQTARPIVPLSPQIKAKAPNLPQAPHPELNGCRHGQVQASGPSEEGLADLRSTTWEALPAIPLFHLGALDSGSPGYSQTHTGVGRKHVDVVLTQRIDDDGLAPVYQVSCKLENLWAEGAGRTVPGRLTHWGSPDYPTSPRLLGTASTHRVFCALSQVLVWFGTVISL